MSVSTIPAREVERLVVVGADTGEGPLWDDREQVLWWVDIPNRALHRHDPATGSGCADWAVVGSASTATSADVAPDMRTGGRD